MTILVNIPISLPIIWPDHTSNFTNIIANCWPDHTYNYTLLLNVGMTIHVTIVVLLIVGKIIYVTILVLLTVVMIIQCD